MLTELQVQHHRFIRLRHFLTALCLCTLVLCHWSGAVAQDGPEGQTEVNAIHFSGNEAFTEAELLAQMSTRESPGFLGRLLGADRQYFNVVTFGADIERLRKFYRNRGFLSARIDTTVTLAADFSQADLGVTIAEGPRARIDTLIYRGIMDETGTLWDEIRSGPLIATGDPFNSVLIEDEVGRVLHILANNGYPNARFLRDSSSAAHYASSGNFRIVLSFAMNRRYRFGEIQIQQEAGTPPRDDITDDIILRQLDYKPGDVFNLDDSTASVRSLNSLGLFDLRRFEFRVPPPHDSSGTVSTLIAIRPKDRHEVAPELIVSNENEAFNLGTGIGYSQRNFFGGGRTFSTRLRFRTQTIGKFPNYFGTTNDAVANLELTFELVQPYLFTNKVRGTWSFSYIIEKQKPFRQNIFRNTFGFVDRLAEYTTGYLDWTLEAVDPRMNPNFVVDTTDYETRAQLRRLEFYPRQFNSILSFTMQRDKSNDIFSPSAGFVHSITLEEAGLLPLALRRAIPDLPFTQFYRVNLLGRWYTDPSARRYSILAFKLKGGIEQKYGESRRDSTRSIPSTHLFYAGGGGSVRGWASRELIASGNPQLGGNLVFEGSVELRTNLFHSVRDGLFDKIWLVNFMDFGNLWREVRDFKVKDLAIATGMGLRYDTFFGPFRFDWGFRVYDPAREQGQQWITQRRFFGETLRESVFHFGIGHAF